MSNDAKLIVGRNKEENERIMSMSLPGDIILEAKDYVGPTCLLRSMRYEESIVQASASILLRYSDSPKGHNYRVRAKINNREEEILASSALDEEIVNLRI